MLHDLDDRSRAVEPDSRSPGGKGYTGLEALLQYVFNQTLAINTFGPFGHLLAVDSFVDPECSPYATPATVALSLKQYGPSYRQCYAWLGPNQPGVNETDPSNPKACVPDPGGAPPGQRGPKTTACKLTVSAIPCQGDARRAGWESDPATTTLRRAHRRAARHDGAPTATRHGQATPQLPARPVSAKSQRQSRLRQPDPDRRRNRAGVADRGVPGLHRQPGLPFVPTRELKVDFASGANLVVGNDVREGGYRIGLVSDMEPDPAAGRSDRRAADAAR